jgi:hypothetical protein
MAIHLLQTESEQDYFESTHQMLLLSAMLIHHASFQKTHGEKNSISYSKQALDLALDQMVEDIQKNKIFSLDN